MLLRYVVTGLGFRVGVRWFWKSMLRLFRGREVSKISLNDYDTTVEFFLINVFECCFCGFLFRGCKGGLVEGKQTVNQTPLNDVIHHTVRLTT